MRAHWHGINMIIGLSGKKEKKWLLSYYISFRPSEQNCAYGESKCRGGILMGNICNVEFKAKIEG